jgi:S-disulfanyl-L-cysteine oxidoreductase SoxD
MRRDTFAVAAVVIALSACSDGGTRAVGGSAAVAATPNAGATATFATYDAGAVPGGPGAEKRYALGHAPAAAVLAAMNRDVGSQGAELPAGRGSVAEGGVLFATQCALCHGKKGEGMAPAFPALIGRDAKAENFVFANDPKLPHTIGNYWPYATTLFDYIRRAMPLTAPGSLTDDQVYALSAYLLATNQVIPDTATLDAAALRRVRMPYQDRFIPDDRTPGPIAK